MTAARPMTGCQRTGVMAGLSLAALVCLGCVLLVVVAQIWLPTANLSFGFVMEICVDNTTSYVEVVLLSPYINSYAPAGTAACLYIPWAPFLPQGTRILRVPI